MKTVAIVPAAGSGRRLKEIKEKPFVKLRSKPLLWYALEALNNSPHIDKIVLVVAGKFVKKSRDLVKKYNLKKIEYIVPGGRTRSDSVLNGLNLVDKDTDYVLIHDGVRPFLEKHLIRESLIAARRFGASCVSVPVKPTIKKAKKGYIENTLKRSILWEAQTPQVFKREVILKAYRNRRLLKRATDDSSLVEESGYKVRIVTGSYRNIKVTTKEDLILAKALLKR
jgi:2-C-methyl-D-erythritol 4-phosphate cytidylyltransferase